jgi:hypothetical protein
MIRFTALAVTLLPLSANAQTTLAEYAGGPAAYLSTVVGGHDLNFDGVPDIVTGARFDNTGGTDAGAVFVHSGATGGLLWSAFGSTGDHLGTDVALSPDLDADGVWEVVVGAPGVASGAGQVRVLSGRTSTPIFTFDGFQPGDALGTAVAGDFDHDRDGTPDIAGGAPFGLGAAGYVLAWKGSSATLMVYDCGGVAATIVYGSSLLGGVDVDGDGYGDLVAAGLGGLTLYMDLYGNSKAFTPPGSPVGLTLGNAGDTDGDGREDVLVGDPSYDVPYPNGGVVWLVRYMGTTVSAFPYPGDAAGQGLGQVVAGIGDVDGDGRGDWAFGATNGVSNPGFVRVISAKSVQDLYRLSGGPATQYPSDVAGLCDVNGDGFLDLAVADSTAGGSDGIVTVFSAYGPGFVNYCAAGTSASGCTPTLSGSGTPSASQPLPFVLAAAGVEGNTPGLFFYGWNGRQGNPWGNGTSLQCVTPPVKRGGLLPKTGASGQCDGAFSQDLNALWSGNPGKNPGAGTVCQAQLWYRDPFGTSNQTTSMSDALEFYVDF